MKLTSMLRRSAACALFASAAAIPAQAQVTLTVDPGATWSGYMNVFDLGNNFIFGSVWGTADLRANFVGPNLLLEVNTIGDPDPFWYIGGGGPGAPGNKIMNANFYQQATDTWSGQMVTFTGEVLSNSFTSAHTAIAFIKDFAPDFSSFNVTTVALTPGVFSINLNTDPGVGRHVQVGFEVTGVNVWATDTAPFGFAEVTAIPEPSSFGVIAALAALFVVARRRRA
jgi:hypothetical protein